MRRAISTARRRAADLAVARERERRDRIPGQAVDHLGPQLGADVALHRRLEAGLAHRLAERRHPGRVRSVGLAERQVAGLVLELRDARSGHLAAGPVGAAQRALGAEQRPLPAAGIGALQPAALERAAELVEEPVGRAGRRRNECRVRPEQRHDAVERRQILMRLEGDDDVVLRAELRRVVGRRHADREILARRYETQAVPADRRQMRTAGDQAHLDALHPRKMRADDSADRAGAVDADLHGRTVREEAAREQAARPGRSNSRTQQGAKPCLQKPPPTGPNSGS